MGGGVDDAMSTRDRASAGEVRSAYRSDVVGSAETH